MTPSPARNLLLASCLLSVCLAVARLVAAVLTGSGAVLADFIHAIAFATSQGLLLVALRRVELAHDRGRALGDLRFWSLVVPMLIYSLGAGVALNEGTTWLQAPRTLAELPLGLSILGAILAVQVGLALVIRRQVARATASERGVLRMLDVGAGAAVAGVCVTIAGLAAAHAFGTVESDALSAVTVGLIMGGAAALTALEMRRLLRDPSVGVAPPLGAGGNTHPEQSRAPAPAEAGTMAKGQPTRKPGKRKGRHG